MSIIFTDKITVKLIQKMGGDHMVVAAAKVSTSGEDAENFSRIEATEDNYGLINYLMKQHHGSVFEHSSMTFFVHAPIFVFREWHRHRVGFCLTGDTEILLWIYSKVKNTIERISIQDAYQYFTGNKYNPKEEVLRTSCMNELEKKFEWGDIDSIFPSGVKEVYRLKVDKINDKPLKVSADHRISTEKGWLKVSQLEGDERVYIRTNSTKAMLGKLKGKPEKIGEDHTYDISMKGPWHNFLANNVVVHNSYNEESGRYKVLEPVFWIPRKNRKLLPVENYKPSRPQFQPATEEQHGWLIDDLAAGYTDAYNRYKERLKRGFAAEVSRAGLPVGIFSSCWVTCNPRSLMHFVALRTHDTSAKFISYPQEEIEEAARTAETILGEGWPLTYKSFCANGRVGP